MEQLDDLLAGTEVTLDDEVLDRIDEIAPPGTDTGPNHVAYTPPAVLSVSLRRRQVAERSPPERQPREDPSSGSQLAFHPESRRSRGDRHGDRREDRRAFSMITAWWAESARLTGPPVSGSHTAIP
jgi:hypothetical protein